MSMTPKTISDLPAITVLDDVDLALVRQGGIDKQCTIDKIRNLSFFGDAGNGASVEGVFNFVGANGLIVSVAGDTAIFEAPDSTPINMSEVYTLEEDFTQVNRVTDGGVYTGLICCDTNWYGASSTAPGSNIFFPTFPGSTDDNHVGYVQLATGNALGDAAWSALQKNTAGYLKIGGGEIIFETIIQLSAVPTSGNDYNFAFGLGNNCFPIPPITTASTDGIYFVGSYAAAAGNWISYSAKAGSVFFEDTGIPVSVPWAKFKIVINATGSEITYYINDILVSTCNDSSKIPAVFVQPLYRIFNGSTRATSIVALIDTCKVTKTFTIPR